MLFYYDLKPLLIQQFAIETMDHDDFLHSYVKQAKRTGLGQKSLILELGILR